MLKTITPSLFRLKSYDRVYARKRDPWGSAVSGSGKKRFTEVFSLIEGRRFDSVLEAGCGRGYFAELLSKAGSRVLGVDVSASAVEAARRRCEGLRNVRFEAGNVLTTRGRFDLVCMLQVVSGFEPVIQERFVEKARSLLRGEGLLLLELPSRPYGLFRPAVFLKMLERRFRVLEMKEFKTVGRSSRYGHLAVLAEKAIS